MILGYDIASVRCTFDHITNDEVDDGFQLWLEFKNGQKAYLEVGTYNFIAMPRFYMRAKGGSAIITDWSSSRSRCKVQGMERGRCSPGTERKRSYKDYGSERQHYR